MQKDLSKMKYESAAEKVFQKNEEIIIYLIMILCIVTNIFPSLALIAPLLIAMLFIVLFCYFGWDTCCVTYFGLTVWDNRLYLLGEIPLITVLKLLLVVKIILKIKNEKIKLKMTDVLAIMILGLYAVISVIIEQRFSGISMLLDMIIILPVINIANRNIEDVLSTYFRKFFFVILLSTVACLIVGYYEYFTGISSETAYIFGQYYKRFQGVIGIDRLCMLVLMALIYPLYYIKNNYRKILLILFLIASVFLTISMTAILCLAIYMVVYFMFQYKGNNKGKIIISVCVIVAYLIYIWNFGSQIGFINTMLLRVQKVVGLLLAGDYTKATSGRVDIIEQYMKVFNEMSIFNKCFGSGIVNQYFLGGFLNYSHNSYVDALLYFGVSGCIVILLRVLRSIKEIRNKLLREQIFLMKIAVVFTGISVSALSADYWLCFFLL